MALKVATTNGARTVGAAFADVTSRQLGVAEFADNDLFSNTESLIIQLSVKECLVQADAKETDYDLAKIRTMLERCGVILTEVKAGGWPSLSGPLIDEAGADCRCLFDLLFAADFNPKNAEQDLNRLFLPKHAARFSPSSSSSPPSVTRPNPFLFY
jgi:DNA mismatch repair ATPase MutS